MLNNELEQVGSKKFPWVQLITGIIVIVVLLMMVKPFLEKTSTNQEGYTCYEYVCTKTSLDNFDNCMDIGIEDTGFLSYEHYYLCDGIKVADNCIERTRVPTNRTRIALGMECEEDE